MQLHLSAPHRLRMLSKDRVPLLVLGLRIFRSCIATDLHVAVLSGSLKVKGKPSILGSRSL